MEAVSVVGDETLTETELTTVKDDLAKTESTSVKEDFAKPEESNNNMDLQNVVVDVPASENALPTEDSSEISPNKGMDQEMTFENHEEGASSVNSQILIEDGHLSSRNSVEIENKMVDVDEGVSDDLMKMELQHEKDMEELRITLQDEYQKQVLKISDELRDHYQTDMDEKITKLEEDWEQEFAKQKLEFDEQVSAVQREQWTQCQEAIERVTLDAEDQLKTMKYAYERETAEHKQRIKELLEREELWEVKEKELANEKCEKENESSSKIKKLENQLSFEREEVESQLNGAQDEIKTLKIQHKSEIESSTAELEKKYSDIVDEMRKELKSKYQDEMDRKVNQVECHLREQYEQDLEKTKEEVRESTSTLKTKYEKQVTEIQSHLEELHVRNQQHELREAKLKANFESEKRKVVELVKEIEKKTHAVEELEQTKKELKNNTELEEKLKQCLDEKCTLEEKVKEISESGAKELMDLREQLAQKSDVIRELEQHNRDSRIDLEGKMKQCLGENCILEEKVKEISESGTKEVFDLREELARKSEVIQELEKHKKDSKIEFEELEGKWKQSLDEKCILEEKVKEISESGAKELIDLREQLAQKSQVIQELEQHKKVSKKHSLDQKFILEEKCKEISESGPKELIDLREELARKSDVIQELDQHNKDSKKKFEELQETLQNLTEEKDALEQRLNETNELGSEIEVLRKELVLKEQEIEKLQQKETDVKNCKEYKELEETIRVISQEKLSLEQALEQTTETQKKQTDDLQEELEKKLKVMQELNDAKSSNQYRELEVKLHEMTLEKQSVQQQFEVSVSEISLLKEKLKEDDNVANDLKSKYDTKILQITRNFEEEVSTLENELKAKKHSEEESFKLKNDMSCLKEEISRLNEELQKHKATISELEETSRSRELEIANLILSSPSPQSLPDKEFDFNVTNSNERTLQLENELAKYKAKVKELEEEAEDKFETTVCPNCNDREKSEEILLQTKTLVDEIQRDCRNKVESLTRDLEKTEKALQEQIKESEGLKEKLVKAEGDIQEERKRSLEILKLGKTVDANANVLGYDGTLRDMPSVEGGSGEGYLKDVNDQSEVVGDHDNQIHALNSLQSQMRDESIEKEDNKTELPKTEDSKSLFDEQEKFYKAEISIKDEAISELIIENEKIQQQLQSWKEKLNKGEEQFEQLRGRTLEQKTKYENEINLMQSEIKMVIQENNEVKERLELLQNNKKEIETLQDRLRESENLKDKLRETENLQDLLRETEKKLEERSTKYEQDIVTLKETLQEKEGCILDIRNALELLENSRKEMEVSISHQKQAFSEKERNLLDEIRNMTVAFENEKTKLLEENFLEKDELKRQIDQLEMSAREKSNFYPPVGESREFGKYEGVYWDNLPKDDTSSTCENLRGTKRYEGVDKNQQESDGKGKLIDVRSQEEVNWDNSLEEHTTSLGDTRSILYEVNYSDNDEGILKMKKERKRTFDEDWVPWKVKHEVLGDKDALGFDDAEFNHLFGDGSPGDYHGLFSDEKYKEIRCDDEENLELLKYEHDIDLLLEKKETERLRGEIETLTKCVDVFHDECESLKRSLDKTVHMVSTLQEERVGLIKEHDLNMAEHSALIQDLIKYEEIIDRLERGNEKLEDDRKFLQECLVEKEAMLSNNTKTKAVSKKLGSEVDEFSKRQTKVSRKDDGYLRNDMKFPKKSSEFLRNDPEFSRRNNVSKRGEGKVIEDLVQETELEFESFLGVDTDPGDIMETFSRNEDREEMFNSQRPFRDDYPLMIPSTSMNNSTEDKNGQNGNRRLIPEEVIIEAGKNNDGSHVKKLHVRNQGVYPSNRSPKEYNFPSKHVNVEENNPLLKYRSELRTSPDVIMSAFTQGSPNRESKLLQNKVTSKKQQLDKPKVKTNYTQTSTRVKEKTSANHLRDKDIAKPTFKSKNESIVFPQRDKVSFNFPGNSEDTRNATVTPSSRLPKRTNRDGYRITEHQKSMLSASRNSSPKVRKLPRTPESNSSTKSPNSSKFSSSHVLTSTGASLTTTDRLVPNLSGVSPIVSPLDRYHHAEKLKWQTTDEERSYISRRGELNQDNTTFLVNVDPNWFLQTPKTPKTERTRSRSADDRFLTSSSNLRHWHVEKPLVINFEDFVFRHRVKSSEDVANLRDPSPAELWFS